MVILDNAVLEKGEIVKVCEDHVAAVHWAQKRAKEPPKPAALRAKPNKSKDGDK